MHAAKDKRLRCATITLRWKGGRLVHSDSHQLRRPHDRAALASHPNYTPLACSCVHLGHNLSNSAPLHRARSYYTQYPRCLHWHIPHSFPSRSLPRRVSGAGSSPISRPSPRSERASLFGLNSATAHPRATDTLINLSARQTGISPSDFPPQCQTGCTSVLTTIIVSTESHLPSSFPHSRAFYILFGLRLYDK